MIKGPKEEFKLFAQIAAKVNHGGYRTSEAIKEVAASSGIDEEELEDIVLSIAEALTAGL